MTPEEKAAADKAANLAKGGEFAALVGDLEKLQKGGMPPMQSDYSQSEKQESSEEEVQQVRGGGGKRGK